MASIPVVWLNYHKDIIKRGFWDQGMLEDVFANRMWRTGYEFNHIEADTMPDVDGAVIIFAARNQVQFIDQLNADLQKLTWVILMLTGDEEAVFPVEKITHANIKIWVMSPRPGRHAEYGVLGTGYPPHMHKNMPKVAPEKDLDYFFAGQITHERRAECAKALVILQAERDFNKMSGECVFSRGFTQGIKPPDYFDKLARTKVAPCPSGPETPDSFRLFEALEAGCIPIADTRVVKGTFPDNYWTFFFNEEPPFPVTTGWSWLPGWTLDQVALYPSRSNHIFAWWQSKKRDFVLNTKEQIKNLSGVYPSNLVDDQITILMPSSPAFIHPSTEHIEQTVRDVRVQLPHSEILLMLDGLRPEQEHKRKDYEEYKRRVLWLCNYQWSNVLPIIFDQFGHQSTMTRKTLGRVKTPFILFVEHDAPLVPDCPIDFDCLCRALESGEANVIRFHHEANIHPEHRHLMLGDVEQVCGAPMIRTAQWSQRPHLASTAFYRHVMSQYFTDSSRAFIEHGLYGPVVGSFDKDGIYGWNIWKLWMYHPNTPNNIKRSYTMNSRGTDPVFESIF